MKKAVPKGCETAEVLVIPEKRIVWIDGDDSTINKSTYEEFARVLAGFEKDGKTYPVIVYITGIGGEMGPAMDLSKIIAGSELPLVCIAHGTIRSAMFILTQAFKNKLAVRGTKFMFHHTCAEPEWRYRQTVTQGQLEELLSDLRRSDAMQLLVFLHNGRPANEIMDLFEHESTISAAKAIGLNLFDGYYKWEDFVKDRKLFKRMQKNGNGKNNKRH